MLEYHKMYISLVVDSSAHQEAELASFQCYHISSRGYKHQGADQMKPGHLESSQPSYRGKTHSASYKVVAVPNLLFIQEIPEIQTFGDKETLY